MQGIIVMLILLACASALVRTARRAAGRPAAPGPSRSGGIIGGWISRRHQVRMANLRHWQAEMREQRRHENRMREARAAGRAAPAGAPSGTGTPPPGPGWRQQAARVVPGRVVRLGDPGGTPPPARSRPARSPAGTPQPPARETASPGTVPAAPVPGPSPASPPAHPVPVPGGNTMSTPAAVPGVEGAIEGLHRIRDHAVAGGIRAKHAAIKALVQLCQSASEMALSLSRALAEPGPGGGRYGLAVTEPLAQAAQHLTAAALAAGEADSALTMLLNRTIGEQADSPEPAPEASELTEAGTY